MKAALAIALSHETKLLILDEATAGMDVSGREEVLEILEDYVSKGHGILLSSHISEDMEQLATTLIFYARWSYSFTRRQTYITN